MKVLTKSVMTAVISVWVSLGVSSLTHAVDTITPGSACQPHNGSDASKIDARADGVFIPGTAGVRVNCPILRTTSAATAVGPAYVELFNGGGTITCTLYSYEWNGAYKNWLFGNCRENETRFNTPLNVFNGLAGQARGFCSRFHGNSQRA
jgi:hypothetical protein